MRIYLCRREDTMCPELWQECGSGGESSRLPLRKYISQQK